MIFLKKIYGQLFPAGARAIRGFRLLMNVYLYMLVILPSGSIFGFNVKILWFVGLLPCALWMYFGRNRATAWNTILLLLVPAVLLVWLLLAQWNGFEPVSSFGHYKDLFVTICTLWFAALICAEGYSASIELLRTILFAEVATSLLKVSLLGYAIARGVPITTVSLWIKNIFGVSLMTYDFASALGRIQFISDGIIPLCVFGILCCRQRLRLKGGLAVAMLLVMLISDFFAFSRYLWVYTVLAIALGLLLGKKDMFQLVLIGIVTTITLVSLPLLVTVISLRFSSKVVDSSDRDRVQQVAALKQFWADAPLVGHGIGSYTTRVIRKDDALYSYESQLLALAGQIGVLGLSGFVLLGMYYYRGLFAWRNLGGWNCLGICLMLAAWIGSGVVNPAVISSAASVSYAALLAMIRIMQVRMDVEQNVA